MPSSLVIHYDVYDQDPREAAEALRVEQSIEFPNDLAPQWIQDEVVGHIVSVGNTTGNVTRVTISYALGSIGGELPALLNVLWGNASMLGGIKVVDVDYPDELLKNFRGPRFGLEGLRNMANAGQRPLASTALKPMGMSSAELADMAYTIAKAGFDTIKDDHSLANQPWSLWEERVELVSAAVHKANAETGGHCLYAPSLNLPANAILPAARKAKELGATSLLLLPGIAGWDVMRAIAEDDEIALPIMAHPAFVGSLVTSPTQGLSHAIVFSQLARIAGADITIFPNFGGRFGFSQEQCLSIAHAARAPLGELRPAWISPAGGMSPDRIGDMIDAYGQDTACLVGGALHRGDLFTNSREMVELLHGYES
ncbi:RuBisCO large subunit C-terminal-like domain-containing protein [Pontimonas sp.]|nr:RuBisCO large subunit C-terminal-like domain-containing protein [Pontimonas sp.]MDA9117068.1 RuBisCO large subunit C-terminal-like domain-containing protein [Pontimonas sp.]